MDKIRIAQIGTGHDHASVTMSTLRLQNDLYEVVGFCTVEEDAENLPAYTYEANKSAYDGIREMTLEEILDDETLDAVCIETEDRALTKYAQMAADRGLHIHMDKPGGIDGEDFNRLVDTAAECGLVFQTGYMYRYNPAVLKLKEEIKEGKLGEILSVEAQMNCWHELPKRNWLGHYPGGMLYFLGCHMVDLVYSIMGEPEEIIPLNCSSGLGGTTAEDFGMAVLRYPTGISIAKSTAIERGGFERRQLVVIGSKGTVELCPFEWLGGELPGVVSAQITGVREAFSTEWHQKAEYHDAPLHGRYDAMMRAFAAYVKGEECNPFDYEYEKNVHRILLKACGR